MSLTGFLSKFLSNYNSGGKNLKKSTFIKIISYILTICITVTNIPISVFAEEISKSESTVEEGLEEMTEGIIEKTESKTVYQLKNGLKKERFKKKTFKF